MKRSHPSSTQNQTQLSKSPANKEGEKSKRAFQNVTPNATQPPPIVKQHGRVNHFYPYGPPIGPYPPLGNFHHPMNRFPYPYGPPIAPYPSPISRPIMPEIPRGPMLAYMPMFAAGPPKSKPQTDSSLSATKLIGNRDKIDAGKELKKAEVRRRATSIINLIRHECKGDQTYLKEIFESIRTQDPILTGQALLGLRDPLCDRAISSEEAQDVANSKLYLDGARIRIQALTTSKGSRSKENQAAVQEILVAALSGDAIKLPNARLARDLGVSPKYITKVKSDVASGNLQYERKHYFTKQRKSARDMLQPPLQKMDSNAEVKEGVKQAAPVEELTSDPQQDSDAEEQGKVEQTEPTQKSMSGLQDDSDANSQTAKQSKPEVKPALVPQGDLNTEAQKDEETKLNVKSELVPQGDFDKETQEEEDEPEPIVKGRFSPREDFV